MDHSCGHDRQRHDGLNVNAMNKGWGGKQRIIHPSRIERVEGYLGKYNSILKPGDTQDMVFSSSDGGPFLWALQNEKQHVNNEIRAILLLEFAQKKKFYN